MRTDLGDLEELTASVKEHGILQPIILAKVAGGLELVAGYRRLEAAKRTGLTEVPVRVVNADENQIAVLRLVENIQREDLSGPDEILAVAKLSAIFPDQVQLAKAIGKSKTYVSRCLKAAGIIRDNRVATSQLSKSAIFELAAARDSSVALDHVKSGSKPTVKAVRERLGPVPGGRYVSGAVQYRENAQTKAFSLRVNYDPARTPPATKEALIKSCRSFWRGLSAE